MSIWPAGPSVKGASKLMSWVSPTSVLFKLFVIMETLIYFRVCHGTPISKNLKTRITCKKIKYIFIRDFNKYTVITEDKNQKIEWLGCSCISGMYLLHSKFPKKNPYLKCASSQFLSLAVELHLARFGLGASFTFELHCSLPSTPSLLLFRFT